MDKIENDNDYIEALKELQKVFHAKSGTKAHEYSLHLVSIIEDYEELHCFIDKPTRKEWNEFMKEMQDKK